MSQQEMDLIGLEEDPDFWKMELDSSSSSSAVVHVNEESGDFVSQCPADRHLGPDVGKHMEMKPPRKTRASHDQDIVKFRDDGKYECNHSCKDKSKCRHLW